MATSSTDCFTMYYIVLYRFGKRYNVLYYIILYYIMLYYTLIFDTILYYSVLYYPIPYCTVFVLETGWPPPPHLSSIFKVEGVATPIHFSLLRGDDHFLRGMVCDTAERGRCLPNKRDEERG